MKNVAIPTAALVLIVAAGFQSRQQSQAEAQNAGVLKRAGENLRQHVPLKIGDWTGEDLPIEERALRAGEIAGCISRKYAHSLTGESAQMELMCGAPGPISAHTPDVCFKGSGYEMISQPERVVVKYSGNREAEFWGADFQKGSLGQRSILRTFWSWKGQAGWRISEHPRIEFADAPVLYKLYVAIPVGPSNIASADERNTEFLRVLLGAMESDSPDAETGLFEP